MGVRKWLLGATAIVALLLIFAPILVVLLLSFNGGDTIAFPPQSLSLRWFRAFLDSAEMRGAFVTSFGLALLAATASTALATLGATCLARQRGRLAALLETLFIAPLVFPAIILGLALLLLYRTLGMPLMAGLAIAHVVVCFPYALRSIYAALQSFDWSLDEAALSLGANPWRAFTLVVVPIIWPSIMVGWMFAFIVSFGEANVVLFLTGPGVTTLPLEIFSYLQFQGDQLVVAAASALQVGVVVLFLLIARQVLGTGNMVRAEQG
jgi:putative spermidine/putrescine transport system permease protein